MVRPAPPRMALDTVPTRWSVDMDAPEATGTHPGYGCNLGHPMALAMTKKREDDTAAPLTGDFPPRDGWRSPGCAEDTMRPASGSSTKITKTSSTGCTGTREGTPVRAPRPHPRSLPAAQPQLNSATQTGNVKRLRLRCQRATSWRITRNRTPPSHQSNTT